MGISGEQWWEVNVPAEIVRKNTWERDGVTIQDKLNTHVYNEGENQEHVP